MSQKLREFYSEPYIGEEIVLDGQHYELIGIEPYERKNGIPSELLEWESQCADCGRWFTTKTGRSIRSLNRRYDLHKKRGVPVAKTKPKKRRPKKSEKTYVSASGAICYEK